MMKKALLICLFITATSALYAQQEVQGDTIRVSIEDNYRKFGEFLLDMALYAPPKLPKLDCEEMLKASYPDFNQLLKLDSNITYSTGSLPNSFSYMGASTGYFSPPGLQMASFKITDNIRLTTYGQYNMDGYKTRPTHGWDKKSFMGGMGLKINKNFGINIEVRTGHNPVYHF